ncbi:unnamed protein product [Sphagnum balticum]
MEQTRKRYAADLKSIMEARKRIAPYAHTTPVITSSTLDALAGRKLFFKCELLQKGGAFKFRGACNAILSLSEDEAKRGVLTHSSGNHAAAVALAARIRGIKAHIVVPRNGGGLISGIALAAKAIKPEIIIIAAEPSGADDAAQSKAAGRIVTLKQPKTIADGLRASLGNFTWPVIRDLVSAVVTVDDDEILEAMKLCHEVLKMTVEPSGAIGLAVILSDKFKNELRTNLENIGIVLSGGNAGLKLC